MLLMGFIPTSLGCIRSVGGHVQWRYHAGIMRTGILFLFCTRYALDPSDHEVRITRPGQVMYCSFHLAIAAAITASLLRFWSGYRHLKECLYCLRWVGIPVSPSLLPKNRSNVYGFFSDVCPLGKKMASLLSFKESALVT